ncbi:2-octaprenyl-6-methoxyphenol hydroxylase [Sinobacterium norvegicum]|uniref:2-octaprenyl-6-methoxyphenol hydroxylase n=1 Tax=Sinobacterium norvegicum TaxID=1641715 RepID=A0ABN8EKC2_9GAMM|nr:2-octaprenyl-6-methoxyphenyl hydroxylase [Sinobacterium norvegicum]CAH0992868.1 2-octaprenyl-6-methoxyphenol hydroxylase [Sinobacterium norvegicum]
MTKTDEAVDFDIVIVGGGMVGASLAVTLGRYLPALSVAIVEGFPMSTDAAKPVYQPSFDARSTALAGGAKAIFEQLGIWSQLAQHCQPIDHIHVSRAARPATMVMDAEQPQSLGYVVENQWLGRVLMAAMQQQQGLTIIAPATVDKVTPCEGFNRLDITGKAEQQQSQLTAKLVIVADGVGSKLAQSLGIQYRKKSYRAAAIVANIQTADDHQGWAFERFGGDGPMAVLPLVGGAATERRSALVWSRPEEEIDDWLSCDETVFIDELQRRFGYRLGKIEAVGERFSYPLQLVEACEQVRTGIVVMGNAAHLLHPVAGQGFNLALRDITALILTLAEAQKADQSIASIAVLNQYLHRQQLDQRMITGFSDLLPEVFASEFWPLSIAREMGLLMLDNIELLKQPFVRHAAGIEQTNHLLVGVK